MAEFPTLETERFKLRQIIQSDSNNLFGYFSLDDVTRFYDVDSFSNIEQASELIQRWNQRFENNQVIRWGITSKSNNILIGTCGFHGWMKNHFKAEIGYELSPSYWNQGVMTEVIKKIIEYGFEYLGLNRIEAFVEPMNIGSRRVLEKVGFNEEGTLKEHYYWKNRFVDNVLYAFLKKDHKVLK